MKSDALVTSGWILRQITEYLARRQILPPFQIEMAPTPTGISDFKDGKPKLLICFKLDESPSGLFALILSHTDVSGLVQDLLGYRIRYPNLFSKVMSGPQITPVEQNILLWFFKEIATTTSGLLADARISESIEFFVLHQSDQLNKFEKYRWHGVELSFEDFSTVIPLGTPPNADRYLDSVKRLSPIRLSPERSPRRTWAEEDLDSLLRIQYFMRENPEHFNWYLVHQNVQVAVQLLRLIPDKETVKSVVGGLPTTTLAHIVARLLILGPMPVDCLRILLRSVAIDLSQIYERANLNPFSLKPGAETAIGAVASLSESSKDLVLDSLKRQDPELEAFIREKTGNHPPKAL